MLKKKKQFEGFSGELQSQMLEEGNSETVPQKYFADPERQLKVVKLRTFDRAIGLGGQNWDIAPTKKALI